MDEKYESYEEIYEDFSGFEKITGPRYGHISHEPVRKTRALRKIREEKGREVLNEDLPDLTSHLD